MISSAFIGTMTLWTLYTIAKFDEINNGNRTTDLKLKATGILIGNIMWLISFGVLLYMFWELGIDTEPDRTRSKGSSVLTNSESKQTPEKGSLDSLNTLPIK